MSQKNIQESLAEEGVTSGVEEEVDGLAKHEPFDPASISISSKVVALESVLRRIRNGTIILNPDFQRNHVWDIARKSRLIESMMLRIPLPMFYVSEDKDGIWEVVDGLQRLTSIRDFILGSDVDGKGFKLKDLEFWGELFDGKDFFTIEKKSKMPRVINNILESELSFTIINPDTPEKVKRNIFKRINTGGMRLSAQEIRHALYQGVSTALLKELIETDEYKKVLGKTVRDDRMAGRELILRHLSFYLRGWKDYKGDMDTFLSDSMRFLNGEGIFSETKKVSRQKILFDFINGLERAQRIFGEHVFRRSKSPQRKTPINKALFDVLMYCFSKISESQFEKILKNKYEFLKVYFEILLQDEFVEAIGRYGADPSGVKFRYDTIVRHFRKFIL